jgi:hypothetical protein
MRDVDDRQTALLQPMDDAKERRDLGVGQGGGRLIHDDQPRIERERLGDLDHLLFGDGEGADDGAGIQLHAQLVEQLPGLPAKLAPTDHLARVRFPADEDILFNREIRHEIELLVDDGDAKILRLARTMEDDRLVIEDDLPTVRLIDPREDFH